MKSQDEDGSDDAFLETVVRRTASSSGAASFERNFEAGLVPRRAGSSEEHDEMTSSFRSTELTAADKFNIMLVDDDPFALKLLEATFLKTHGNAFSCKVMLANSGEKALHMLSNCKEPFDLLLSDVNMPGMDGFLLIELIKTTMNFDILVALISADLPRNPPVGVQILKKPLQVCQVDRLFKLIKVRRNLRKQYNTGAGKEAKVSSTLNQLEAPPDIQALSLKPPMLTDVPSSAQTKPIQMVNKAAQGSEVIGSIMAASEAVKPPGHASSSSTSSSARPPTVVAAQSDSAPLCQKSSGNTYFSPTHKELKVFPPLQESVEEFTNEEVLHAALMSTMPNSLASPGGGKGSDSTVPLALTKSSRWEHAKQQSPYSLMMLLLENISNGQLPSRSDAIAMRQMLMNSDLMFTPLFLHESMQKALDPKNDQDQVTNMIPDQVQMMQGTRKRVKFLVTEKGNTFTPSELAGTYARMSSSASRGTEAMGVRRGQSQLAARRRSGTILASHAARLHRFSVDGALSPQGMNRNRTQTGSPLSGRKDSPLDPDGKLKEELHGKAIFPTTDATSGEQSKKGEAWKDASGGGVYNEFGDEDSEQVYEDESDSDDAHAEHPRVIFLLSLDQSFEFLENWPQIVKVIEDLPNYEFDVIEFAQLLGETKSVLAVVGILMMHAWNLLEKLEIQPETMYRYLIWVGSNMIKTNAYHNEMHVADVVQSVCLLLGKHVDTDMTIPPERNGLVESLSMTPLEVMAVIFAAAIHDLQHLGVTNDFLVKAGDDIALLYNDRAVLESHSASLAFRVMKEEEYNVFEKMDPTTYSDLRLLVLSLVAATDMKKHFRLVTKFGAIERKIGEMSITKSLPSILDKSERELVLRCALKVADLGHLRSLPHVHQQFTSFLMEEFFAQGDKLRELGMEISPIFERKYDPYSIAQSQVGFFDFVANPLFDIFCKVFPSPWMSHSENNYRHWKQIVESHNIAQAASSTEAS